MQAKVVTRVVLGVALLAVLGLGDRAAQAANFTISAPSTTAQTLGTGSGQTGTVNAGSSLTVSGNTVAVTISGNNATLTNLGTISQTGAGRAIRDNTGITGLVVNNGSATNSAATITTADADVIQMNKSPASVTLNNWGTMTSLNASGTLPAGNGAQVVDFTAILSGANTVNNFAGGTMTAYEADTVRTGVNGVVYNAGTIRSITTVGNSSDGIDAQTNTGLQVTNDTTGLVDGARHGITGGATPTSSPSGSFTASITNNAGGIIRGNNGSGINIDGFNGNELVTVTNRGLIQGNGVTGDGDGIDVDGLVYITNSGTIRSLNSVATTGFGYSEGITAGGGTIINSGLILGSVAAGNASGLGRGITIAGIDKDPTTSAAIPVQAPYGAAVITNSGTIRGDSDSAIVFSSALASGYTHSITNQAGGLIQTGGTGSAAIVTAADAVSIVNSGTIDGASSGKAIQGGAGNVSVSVTGGGASILGDLAGGSGQNTATFDPGTGNGFSYAGGISNFFKVSIESGDVALSGASSYVGQTVLDGGRLTLDGANRLAAGSELVLNGGSLRLLNAGGANGQTFASLSLLANATIDLGGSSLTFNGLGVLAAGKSMAVLMYDALSSPGYAIRVLGDQTANSQFQAFVAAMTINGQAATMAFDGLYTDLKASAVPLPGSAGLMLSGLVLLGAWQRRRRGPLAGGLAC